MTHYESTLLRLQSFEAKKYGDYKRAIFFRYQILEQGMGELDDFYFLGQWSVEVNEYEFAEKILTQCIEWGKNGGNGWYDSCAYLLRAYAFIKCNRMQDESPRV
ncbi:TPA: hypothetical protein MEA72_004528 [Klebsiella aerogenes]|nr:hypothetical protein [Klebsiella aerogenes]